MAYGPYGKIHRLVNDDEMQDMEMGLMPGSAYMMGLRLSPLSTRSGTAAEIALLDNERIVFGSSTDATITWDASNLIVDSSAAVILDDTKLQIGTGTGASAVALDGTDPDQVLQVYGVIAAADVAAGAYAGVYCNMAVNADQDEDTSTFALWGELTFTGADMTGSANHAAVWANLEFSGTCVSTDSGDWTAASMNVINADQHTTNNTTLFGVGVQSNMHASITNNGTVAGVGVFRAGGKLVWPYGLYLETGACATGITGSVTTKSVNLAVTALPANARGSSFTYSCATPAMSDGYGAFEIDLTITGTATGHASAQSSWVNLGDSATIPSYLFVRNDGVWDGGATLTNAYIAWGKYQCLLSTNPAHCSLWELNFSGSNSELDSIFNVNSAALALGYEAGSPSESATGKIPFFSEAGGSPKYIYTYDT